MITFNGKSLRDFGVFTDESGVHTKAKKSYEKTSVAGRNGDLTYSNHRYENLSVEVPCFIRSDYVRRYAALMEFLTSEDGYKRLEFESEADFYREAVLDDSDTPETGAWSKSATFTLTFDCKPQRWLKLGEKAVEKPSSLFNPTLMNAAPLIRVYGSGTLKVGTETLTIAKHSYEYIDIDCYLQDCYYGTTNCNSLVTLSSGDFPVLTPGKNGFSFTGGNYKVTPRWWTI